MMSKIGIMGGTFDPIHNGHLLIGKQAYEEYNLDQVWFMPSGQPPHKTDHIVTEADIRCEMTQLAIQGYDYFVFSDFEVKRSGNSYTAQTLKLLKEIYPEHDFCFIIGEDSLFEIESWSHPQEVMEQTVLLVAGRDYDGPHRTMKNQILYLKEKYNAKIYRLHSREIAVSSGELREIAAAGGSLKPYVPEQVFHYIKTHHLYEEAASHE